MLIGLDFDNTLACYDNVFSDEAKKKGLVANHWDGNKKDLKNELISFNNDSHIWQSIQGQVYGPSMHKAILFPGVSRFLLRCKLQGHAIFIVSHKTKYGHFDSTKTPLREAATNWMENLGFFDEKIFCLSKDNVFFEDTRQEKVERIKNLDIDVFIDDLEEVFAEESFPNIKKILFTKTPKYNYHDTACNNWTDIANSCIGEITDKEIKYFASSILNSSVQGINMMQGGRNSRLYELSTHEMGKLALKDYPDLLVDPRSRLQTEVQALKMIEDLHKTPKVVAFDEKLNVAIYEWIEGVHISRIEDNHINEALKFIENIQRVKSEDAFVLASEACLSAKHLFTQINYRLDKLSSSNNKDLQSFINLTFVPLFNSVRNWSEQHWPKDNLTKDLPDLMQVISPSDFGFHNALLKNNGELYFLDFEYFGRDDPVKLIADFVWHPGMNLNDSHKTFWISSALKVFNKDPDIYSRFLAAWPLYGLRWSLILLNEFVKKGWQKRVYTNMNIKYQYENRLIDQLNKAKLICEQVQETNMECPYMNDSDEQNI
jgi:hypothetical protein